MPSPTSIDFTRIGPHGGADTLAFEEFCAQLARHVTVPSGSRFLRNGRGATSVATYSTRARAGAAVATPLKWDELPRTRSADAFTVKNLHKRLASLGRDPWDGYFDLRQQLPAAGRA